MHRQNKTDHRGNISHKGVWQMAGIGNGAGMVRVVLWKDMVAVGCGQHQRGVEYGEKPESASIRVRWWTLGAGLWF